MSLQGIGTTVFHVQRPLPSSQTVAIVAGAAAVCVVLAKGGAVSHACCCRDGEAPIHKAALGGYLSCLEFLVARGADVHAQDE